MKKISLLIGAILMSEMAFAFVTVTPGAYQGLTEDDQPCYISITSDSVSVGAKEVGKPYKAITVLRSEATESVQDGVYSAKGSGDIMRMSLAANLDSKGQILNASFRLGFLFGTRFQCLNMKMK